MSRRAAVLMALGVTAAIVAFPGRTSLPRETARAQQSNPSLEVASCVEVNAGDTFKLEIVVRDVTRLLAWELYFAYDPEILEVVDRDVGLFLDIAPNSNVIDFSDPVPNATGLYRSAAADLSMGDTAESGDGFLARFTVWAKREGVTPANIFRVDLDSDGVADFGPTLSSVGGTHLGDANGNGIFDGAVFSGQIAVGRPCLRVAPTPNPDDVPSLTPRPSPSTTSPSPGVTTATVTPTIPVVALTPSPTPRGPDVTPVHPSVIPSRPSATPADNAGSGASLATLLIAIIGASSGLGLAFAYIIYRSSRTAAR